MAVATIAMPLPGGGHALRSPGSGGRVVRCRPTLPARPANVPAAAPAAFVDTDEPATLAFARQPLPVRVAPIGG